MIKLIDILNEIEILDPTIGKLNIINIRGDYRILPKYNPGMEVNDMYDNDHHERPGKICFLEEDGVYVILSSPDNDEALLNYLKKKYIPFELNDRGCFIPLKHINIIKNPVNEIEVLDPLYNQIPHDKSIQWVLYVKNEEEWDNKWAPILDRLGYEWSDGKLPSQYFRPREPYVFNNYFFNYIGRLTHSDKFPDKKLHFRKINFK